MKFETITVSSIDISVTVCYNIIKQGNIMYQTAKSKIIYKALAENIKNLPAGGKLPSVRELLQTYQIGRGLLERVLTELEKNGLVERTPRLGIFSKLKESNFKHRIAFISPNWPSETNFSLHTALSKAIAADGRFTYTYYNLSEPFFSQLSEKMGDILIVLPPSGLLSLNDLAYLKQLTVPAVLISRNMTDMEGHYVNACPEYGGMLAAEYLLRHGHRNLAVLFSEPHVADIVMRVNSFVHYAKLNNANVETIDCKIHNFENSASKTYETLSEYLKKNPHPAFTGLFVVSDATAMGAMKALREADIKIPDDMSVIGYDGITQGEFLHPPLTSIFNDNDQIASRLVSAIGKYVKGDIKNIRIDNEPRILIRKSVEKCPS